MHLMGLIRLMGRVRVHAASLRGAPFVPACSPELLRTSGVRDSADLAGESLIVHARRADLWDKWAQAAGLAPLQPRQLIRFDTMSAVVDAAERGAANVTVMLDGRYATQTNANGQFEFAYVVAGSHVLTVVSDNLPLPWGLDKEGRTELRVHTRETTTVDIGAQKQ